MNSEQMNSRIAPTPSGYLHLGNAFNFILTYLWVRSHSGVLKLRIDDNDSTRMRDEYIEDIFHSLDFLKIDYDFGPQSVEDFKTNFSQAKRSDYYKSKLKLLDKKDVFACECSRKDITQLSEDGKYPGTCHFKELALEKDKTCLRIFSSGNIKELMGDFILWRKDDLPAYQLVSVIDDIDMNINTIFRGEDLYESSLAQKFLASKLGLQEFNDIKIYHHPLVTNGGEKLSKSEGAFSLKEYREGYTFESILHAFCDFFNLPKADQYSDLIGQTDLLSKCFK